jgi:hypothetical protein
VPWHHLGMDLRPPPALGPLRPAGRPGPPGPWRLAGRTLVVLAVVAVLGVIVNIRPIFFAYLEQQSERAMADIDAAIERDRAENLTLGKDLAGVIVGSHLDHETGNHGLYHSGYHEPSGPAPEGCVDGTPCVVVTVLSVRPCEYLDVRFWVNLEPGSRGAESVEVQDVPAGVPVDVGLATDDLDVTSSPDAWCS